MKRYLILFMFLTYVVPLSAKGLIYVFSVENRTTKGHEVAKGIKIPATNFIVIKEGGSKLITLNKDEVYQFSPPLLVLNLNQEKKNVVEFSIAQNYLVQYPSGPFLYFAIYNIDIKDNKLILQNVNNLEKTFEKEKIEGSFEDAKLREKDWLVNIVFTNNGPQLKVMSTDSIIPSIFKR